MVVMVEYSIRNNRMPLGFLDAVNGLMVNKSVIAVSNNKFPINQSNPNIHNVFFVGF